MQKKKGRTFKELRKLSEKIKLWQWRGKRKPWRRGGPRGVKNAKILNSIIIEVRVRKGNTEKVPGLSETSEEKVSRKVTW